MRASNMKKSLLCSTCYWMTFAVCAFSFLSGAFYSGLLVFLLIYKRVLSLCSFGISLFFFFVQLTFCVWGVFFYGTLARSHTKSNRSTFILLCFSLSTSFYFSLSLFAFYKNGKKALSLIVCFGFYVDLCIWHIALLWMSTYYRFP